jgi:hypothetical protein
MQFCLYPQTHILLPELCEPPRQSLRPFAFQKKQDFWLTENDAKYQPSLLKTTLKKYQQALAIAQSTGLLFKERICPSCLCFCQCWHGLGVIVDLQTIDSAIVH